MKDPRTTMSQMIPAREAAERVGYSLDYVSRLARQQKISGEQRGRQWFVDVESLKLFSLQAKAEQRKRQEQLRTDRQAELLKLQKNILAEKETSAVESANHLALGKTAVLALSLAIVATLTWNVHDAKLNLQALSIGATDISEIFKSAFGWGGDVVAETSDDLVVSESDTDSSVAQGIVLFDATTTDAELAAVADSFSDEVEVTFEGETTGVVTPEFRSGPGESYRFLLVPVNTTE